jgi:hypothetical protein
MDLAAWKTARDQAARTLAPHAGLNWAAKAFGWFARLVKAKLLL